MAKKKIQIHTEENSYGGNNYVFHNPNNGKSADLVKIYGYHAIHSKWLPEGYRVDINRRTEKVSDYHECKKFIYNYLKTEEKR